MLITIRIVRVLVGLITIWQVIGIIPAVTWLQNLEAVTVGMWILIAIKTLAMLLFGGIYFWLGRVKRRIDKSGRSTSEAGPVVFIVVAVFFAGVIIAIVIPDYIDIEQEGLASESSAHTSRNESLSSKKTGHENFSDLGMPEAPSKVDFLMLMAPPHASEVAGHNRILQAHPDAIEISRSDNFRVWALNTPKTWGAIRNHDVEGLIAVFSEFKSRK
jgi:hypothetical protein